MSSIINSDSWCSHLESNHLIFKSLDYILNANNLNLFISRSLAKKNIMGRLIFSGHEPFSCKQFWLKKGFDFVKENKSFRDKTAVIHLGVGKNMVNSIRFWVKAFGVVDGDEKPNLRQISQSKSFCFFLPLKNYYLFFILLQKGTNLFLGNQKKCPF